MVGKKKTKDIQFYREATDLAFDETGNRRRRYKYGDEDELEQEQMERQRRAALNKDASPLLRRFPMPPMASWTLIFHLESLVSQVSPSGPTFCVNLQLTVLFNSLILPFLL